MTAGRGFGAPRRPTPTWVTSMTKPPRKRTPITGSGKITAGGAVVSGRGNVGWVHQAGAQLTGEGELPAVKPIQFEGDVNKAALNAKLDQHIEEAHRHLDKAKDNREAIAYLDQVQAPHCEPAPAAAQNEKTQPVTIEPNEASVSKTWIENELKGLLKIKAIPADISRPKLERQLKRRINFLAR